MKNIKTVLEWEESLGHQVRSLRLRQNLSQSELASRAGAALNAVKNLELGKGSSLTSLIKILRVLGKAEWLTSLAPTISISPMQMISAKTPRKRASKGHAPHV